MKIDTNYELGMHLGPTETDTRIVLGFAGHQFPMSIGDTSIVYEMAKGTVDLGDGPPASINGVKLDDGRILNFIDDNGFLRVVGSDDLGAPLATLILDRPVALQFCRALDDWRDDIQEFLKRHAAEQLA